MKLLLYCTKAKPYLYHDEDYCYDTMNTIDLGYKTFEYTNQRVYDDETGKFLGWENYDYWYNENTLNGKILIECDYEVEEIEKGYGIHHTSFDEEGYFNDYYDYMTKTMDEDILLKRSCLNVEELETYNPNYAIHIKNLKIFDKPRELNHYMVYDKSYDNMFGWAFEEKEKYKPLTKAPQNMMYVYDNGVKKVLISIQSQWMCLILNRIKDVEVRRTVLKEMLK